MAELLLEELTIRTTEGLRSFRVEVARTNKEQSTGLTGREKLAPDRGMLFDLGTERQINMKYFFFFGYSFSWKKWKNYFYCF